MKLVLDTDVLAAALLGEPAGEEAERLIRSASELYAPSHIFAELTNVVWKAVTQARLAAHLAAELLALAENIPLVLTDVRELWHGALMRSIEHNHPAYDTLFVELAMQANVPMASYDNQLRKQFPRIVRTPKSLLQR